MEGKPRRVKEATVKPNCYVALLLFKDDTTGTGVLVRTRFGNKYILTAAHNLHGVDSVDILFAKNGMTKSSFPPVHKSSEDFLMYGSVCEMGIQKSEDIAFICLNGNDIPDFKAYAEFQSNPPYENGDFIMVGYPEINQPRQPGWPKYSQWDVKLLTIAVQEHKLFTYEEKTYPGMSGSPIFEKVGSKYVLRGIHTRGGTLYNEGIRLSLDQTLNLSTIL